MSLHSKAYSADHAAATACWVFLMKEEAKTSAFKAMKYCVALFMCANAADFMVNPGLVYRSANHRCFRNKNINTLPVHWMHN